MFCHNRASSAQGALLSGKVLSLTTIAKLKKGDRNRWRTVVRHMDVQRLQRPRQHAPLHAPERQVLQSALQVHSRACAQHARACCVYRKLRSLGAEGAELKLRLYDCFMACVCPAGLLSKLLKNMADTALSPELL